MTRRTILRLIPTAPAIALFGSQSPATAQYRADCQVSFLGVPVFARSNVGSASIEVRETAGSIALTFQAGSLPERTRGLNRLGFIQELVTQKDGGLQSTYFGFITSSPEKNLEQAKAALGPTEGGAVSYMAVEGSASKARSQYDLYQLELPSTWNYSRCTEVVGKVRDFLAKKTLKPARSEASSSVESPRTFLFAVREAMRSSDTKIKSAFLYNGQSFRLDVVKSRDNKPGGAMRLNGNVQNVATGDKTPFRLWFHEGADLPTRFEYRPRGYLNLTFERTSA
ncbi:MAG: hypothetical protein SGI92_09295 [Bryobacteraceae bacterium]|nr:hypothetical protein [Bryobacteraceae bacterium]